MTKLQQEVLNQIREEKNRPVVAIDWEEPRDLNIRKLYDAGYSGADIARMFHVTRQAIYKQLQPYDKDRPINVLRNFDERAMLYGLWAAAVADPESFFHTEGTQRGKFDRDAVILWLRNKVVWEDVLDLAVKARVGPYWQVVLMIEGEIPIEKQWEFIHEQRSQGVSYDTLAATIQFHGAPSMVVSPQKIKRYYYRHKPLDIS